VAIFFARQVPQAADLGVGRHRHHPAHRIEAGLGVHEVRHHRDLGVVLHGPVFAGDAAVQGAVLHVAAHLLGPAHGAGDLRVVDIGKITPAIDLNMPTGTPEEFQGRLLQTAFGDA